MNTKEKTNNCLGCALESSEPFTNARKFCNTCIINWLRDEEELMERLFEEKELEEDSFDV